MAGERRSCQKVFNIYIENAPKCADRTRVAAACVLVNLVEKTVGAVARAVEV